MSGGFCPRGIVLRGIIEEREEARANLSPIIKSILL